MFSLPKHIFYVKHACSAQAYILCQTCLLCPSIYFMSNMSNEGIPGNINREEQSTNNHFHVQIRATARGVFEVLINPTSS
jgi:hypothetical protein